MSTGHRARRGSEAQRQATHLVLGLGLMALGSLMILGRLDLLDYRAYTDYWPMLLVAAGTVRLVVPDEDGRRGGLWLLAIGLLLQLHVLRILRFRESWPLFLVVTGLEIVLETLGRRRPEGAHDE
jgi:branched-subunit amino acid ABC-type transport system permease component